MEVPHVHETQDRNSSHSLSISPLGMFQALFPTLPCAKVQQFEPRQRTQIPYSYPRVRAEQ